MPQNPNKIVRFWQELKRRKVFRVLTIYAGIAYIVLELANNISGPLALPEWVLTLTVFLLALGFPIVAILSWIFDITPEGVKKTEPAKIAKAKQTAAIPPKRKLKVSDVIIAVLVVVVGIMAYPKIFRKDKFEGIRDAEGKISIAVMPFENLTGDSLYNVWQGGFQNLLITTLSNSRELSVRQYEVMHAIMESINKVSYASITPSAASGLALKLDTKTFILGNILKAGEKIRVTTQLVNAETEEIYKTYEVKGNTQDDIFRMADSLSILIRSFLETKKLIEKYESPDLRGTFYTNSPEAFQYYINAYEALMNNDFQTAIESGSKAIEVDSNFINAYIWLSVIYFVARDYEQSRNICNMVYKKRDELPLNGKLMLDELHAFYFETPYEEIKYLKQLLVTDELNSNYWYWLGLAYSRIPRYREAIESWEKALEIHKKWGTPYNNPWIYCFLGDAYRLLNEHKSAKEVYELGLSALPDHPMIIRYQTVCYLSEGDTVKANELLMKYKSFRKSESRWPESHILSLVGSIYFEANVFDKAEKNYRRSIKLDPHNALTINNLAYLLIDNDINVEEGMKLVQKALEIEPDNWYALDTKGWGLYKQGRYEEALEILKNAWNIRPFYTLEGAQHIQAVEKAVAGQNL